MPFTVDKAELDRYVAGLDRAVALDLRGALSRAIVVEVARRRPHWTWGRAPGREADVDHLERLHGALRGSALMRRRGRRLFATKLAGQL